MIAPAVAELAAEGIAVTGPHSADTLFHAEARGHYDAAVAMYHDQALIPIKTLAFDRGVNVTLGLPFVRTSPDHGTAFELAGTGKARPDSFIAALRMAHEIGLRRAAARPPCARCGMSERPAAGPDGLPPLGEVIRGLGLSARKSLGQNFILDLNLTRRIARAAGPLEGRTVVEVGPGPGGLTRALFLEGAERVVAVERDERCRPALEAIAERYPGRLDGPLRRCAGRRLADAGRRRRSQADHRRQPALQRRHAFCSSAGSRASPGRPGTRAWC